MKQLEEIKVIFNSELTKHLEVMSTLPKQSQYYNEFLGDVSVILAALIESSLRKNFVDWDHTKWMDDSLITKLVLSNDKLNIAGVVIWGRENTTQQWTDPFRFEAEFREDGTFSNFLIWFQYVNTPELTFDEFKNSRNYYNSAQPIWKYQVRI